MVSSEKHLDLEAQQGPRSMVSKDNQNADAGPPPRYSSPNEIRTLNSSMAQVGEGRARNAMPLLDNDLTPGNQPETVVGDYDNDANGLWSLYGKEANSHDEAMIETWKGDMDGILIFVCHFYLAILPGFTTHRRAGLFSAALTAFLIESYKNLKTDPAEESTFYGKQTVAILAQISQQIAGLAPQSPVTPAQPQLFPAFNPSQSDIRVNVYWFMSLIFSLSAALTATIVQQWVRDYMHLFRRYDHPLKSARIRQFLHEGTERWHMPIVADAVPALVHIALFLFFIGLADFLFNINTTVAVATVAPIAIGALLYLWSVIAPSINPQSPYQNSFSGIFWYILHKVRRQMYTYRGSTGAHKPVSTRMVDGRMQLAMVASEEWKKRDARGIRWLVGNLTEESEITPLIVGVPGTFKTRWGRDVWSEVSEAERLGLSREGTDGGANRPPPRPLVHGYLPRSLQRRHNSFHQEKISGAPALFPEEDDLLRDLCRRTGRVIDTCVCTNLLAEDVRRRRSVASIDTAAWLVCYANSQVDWFGDPQNLRQVLTYVVRIAIFVGRRTPEWVANYPLFVRCACLGLVAIKGPLRERTARASAQRVISAFAQTYNQADSIAEDGSDIQQAVIHAQRIDGHLNTVWRLLRSLDEALAGISPNSTGAQLTELLHSQETVFRELGACQTEGERLRRVLGKSVSSYTDALTEASDGLFPQLPFGHKIPISPSAPLGKLLDSHPAGKNAVFTSKLVSPGGMICILCTLGPKFQKLLQDKNIHDLRAATSELRDLIEQLDPVMKNARLVEQLAWRFCDVRDGNALGYIIEIFFMQIANLSNHVNRTLMSAELHRQIYINTFRAITLDWRHHDKRLETQHLILNVLCELLGVRGGFRTVGLCPEYLIGEFIAFTGEYFAGESGPHIDAIVDELGRCAHDELRNRALRALSRIA